MRRRELLYPRSWSALHRDEVNRSRSRMVAYFLTLRDQKNFQTLRSIKSAAEHIINYAARHRYYKEPMEVGPTTHYIMGGVRMGADSNVERAWIVRSGRNGRGLLADHWRKFVVRPSYSVNARVNAANGHRTRYSQIDDAEVEKLLARR
jgi:hypothetical protein